MMNIDRALANRALAAVGQSELDSADTSSKAYLMVKKFYLTTMLESLETASWTSGKKRKVLEKAAIDNYTDFAGAYRLPIDCGKIIELTDKSFYIVEGNILYTDSNEPVLVYVTNGRIPEGTGNPDEDFPDYAPPEYEAMFYQAFELRLASKFALELSGKPDLHRMLLQEAAMIEAAGYRNSKTLSAGKKKGKQWWIE